MAYFKKTDLDFDYIDRSRKLSGKEDEKFGEREFYLVSGSLTNNDITLLNQIKNKTTLIIKNTKGQDSDLISQISNSNVNFSVVGGNNYLEKDKFKRSWYYERTVIDPHALVSVIKYFKAIEGKLNNDWNETQKCLFVYNTLCKDLHYCGKNEPEIEMGKDVVRSLDGLLYQRLVCAGFAVVMKEAMERIDISCDYQNKRNTHDWNIAKLDGVNRLIDLSSGCCLYNNKNAELSFFGFDVDGLNEKYKKVYDNKNDMEEKHIETVPFKKREVIDTLNSIMDTNIIHMASIDDFNVISNRKSDGTFDNYVYIDGNLLLIKSSENPELCLSRDSIEDSYYYNDNCIGNVKNDNKIKRYVRDDNSQFLITKTKDDDDYNTYTYFEVIKSDGDFYLRKEEILSEMDLVKENSEELDCVIANGLLSKKRLERKLDDNYGYVGYYSKSDDIYYSKSSVNNKLRGK